ncbi:MAG TPA: 4-hydroxybenzoyl-CoA reductase subunit alpha [Candidatus Acidoferrales bacterium]|jgi:4-hydroxybenzoyl-CoA reductase subunit alpha|nr:4-hydroxybenzoyl-CoA reductase subunit alpha [Candidatus Acidoferrales bacterium]
MTIPAEKNGVVGRRMAMTDSLGKVTGLGKYTDDLAVPGMLVGKILHSPHAHARIRAIDTSRAEALAGVKAVATGKDAPNPYGILPIGHDERVLALDKARYIGDNVAAVAATSAEIAEQALDLIEVDYEVLPAWFDPEKSMLAETHWIHEGRPHNIEKEYHHEFGDLEEGFRQADFVAEQRYYAGEVNHAAMEPHSTLAIWEPEGRLTVYSSTQVPYYLQRTVADVCEMPMSSVRIIKPLIGGGFGGKSEVIPLEVAACVLAKQAKRPVKITYTREEVFYAHRGRPITIVELKAGLARDGRITAIQARVVQDGGAYCGYGPVTVLYSGALLGAIYDIPNVHYDGYRVLTNKPACGAMRGHGTVNVRFAFEAMLDRLACDAGLDPADVRRRNLLKAPCITPNGLRVTSYGLPECIEKVVERSGWNAKKGNLPYGKGIGIACSHYVSGAANPIIRSNMPHTTVNIKIDRDATVTVFTGASEIGQGSDTIQVQIVAEVLGVEPERIRLVAADTALTPVDLGSYSSRVTFMAGNACIEAAKNMREQILAAVAKKFGCAATELEAGGEAIYKKDDPRMKVGFDEAVVMAIDFHGGLVAQGSYAPPEGARGGKFKGAGVGPSPSYSYSAQVAEVTVDPETGRVRVDKIVAAHDCGRALNPLTVEGQIEGSVYMGFGQALQEEMIWEKGRLMNPSLLEYRIPSTIENPEIESIIVESIDPEGPFGAKEAGEGSLAATIPAIASAIYDAVGVRINSLPITPEKVLEALQKKRKAAGGNGAAGRNGGAR